MTSSLDWVGWVTAALGAAQALGAVRRLLWRRRPARRAPDAGIRAGLGTGYGTEQRPCGCLVPRVLRYEAADGSTLTVWTVRPVPDGCREESRLW
ncbi:hypothetical protein ABZ508_27510 [Streptomyces lavendulocolor]|uniref:Uncharacterized protein n=1 Tax=Streptomyces lavendulocolor TaxID=67316 RepID=A0ABV2WCM4_9ACTN|nr:hypothetical protein A4V12_29635 [Streptomyces noursei]